MKKYFPLILTSLLLLAVVAVLLFRLHRNSFETVLVVETDAMSVVNYYYPRAVQLQKARPQQILHFPAFVSTSPKYGALRLGSGADSEITIMLDEQPDGGMPLLYVDKNNNEDLTDDGEAVWDEDKPEYWMKEVLIDVSYRSEGKDRTVPYPVKLYRYKYKLPNAIVAFRSGYRKGVIALRDSSYKIAVFDDDVDGLFHDLKQGALVIDLNRDGVLQGGVDSPEYFPLTSSFNVNGVSYGVKKVSPAGDRIRLAVVDSLIFPKQDVESVIRAPQFRMPGIDGQSVDLTLLRSKVVLVDFWATWCEPWERNLPALAKIYSKYHHKGFELIGVSLDEDLVQLNAYLKEKRVRWPQIADRRGWDMPLAGLYKVNAIPKNFLLDKKGMIRYRDLYGAQLETKVFELLNE